MTTVVEDLADDARAPVRRIAALGFPLLLGALSSSMSGIVDTAMMGRYGTADLAAVSGASAVFDVFASIVLASVIGHQILAPRFAGRGDAPGIVAALRSSILFCGGIALVLTLLCEFAGGWLTGIVSSGHPELRAIGAQYLAARGPTLLLLVGFSLLTATFNAYKKPRFAAVAGVLVNVVNLVLDWLLIYGPGPFPRWGALGNGLATTIAWAAGCAWLLLMARRFRLAAKLREPGPGTKPEFTTSIPKLAWPAMVSSGLDYASQAIFFAIIAGIGEAALAGGRIAFEITVLVFGVGMSFAAASRILIGRAAGADRFDELRVFWRVGQYVLFVPGLVLGVLLAVFPSSAAYLFTSFGPVVGAVVQAMPLVAVCVPLIAWTLGNLSLLRAMGKTTWDMYGNLVSALLIQLPLSWLLVHVAGLGIPGAYLGVTAYWLIRAVFTEVLARRLLGAHRSAPVPQPA